MAAAKNPTSSMITCPEHDVGGLARLEAPDDHRAAVEAQREPVTRFTVEQGRELEKHLPHPHRAHDATSSAAPAARGPGTRPRRSRSSIEAPS